MSKVSKKELENDIRDSETVIDHANNTNFDKIEDLVGVIYYHFRYAYGGYGGYFQRWSELEEDVRKWISSYSESRSKRQNFSTDD